MSDKVYMLNALWFKTDGGAEKYAEYAAAAAPFVQELGGRLLESYMPETALIGEWDPDLFFVVEWPDWESFTKLPQAEGYLKIAHLREEALENSLLIRCRRQAVDPAA
ncbi:MAG: DUF1330 domain-containing protein [Deltaproteobacteria bacterium]|nr:DUF1330 domain-containing protein [Deltaproteobacteria bacterium]MBW2414922.1 DUF1330 domain-containing protein [Deltaproteobacteria bacterium]